MSVTAAVWPSRADVAGGPLVRRGSQGAGSLDLYQPHYRPAYDLEG